MQYTQRKLQRSVTEMRRSRTLRPRRSNSDSPGGGSSAVSGVTMADAACWIGMTFMVGGGFGLRDYQYMDSAVQGAVRPPRFWRTSGTGLGPLQRGVYHCAPCHAAPGE